MVSARISLKYTINTMVTLFCVLGFYSSVSCNSNQADNSKESQQKVTEQKQTATEQKQTETQQKSAEPVKSNNSSNQKVTFIELGSVNCIPCRMMVPVMENVEKKYGDQVKVVFHDVWTPEGRPYGAQYGITAIPTQVFLDKDGKEYFRHEGFFAEEELVKILQMKGVK